MVYLLFIAIGICVAIAPITMAVFPWAWGIDTKDPSWGAALPFLMFITVPAGAAISAVMSLTYGTLRFFSVDQWIAFFISVAAVFLLAYLFAILKQ